MHLLSEKELEAAAEEEAGLCLECGSKQEFYERDMMRFGLCGECGLQRVIRALDLWDGIQLLEDEE